MNKPFALEVERLAKSFDGVPALHPLDLTVSAGAVHGLVGQNGCGKSTLVKCLTGYHRPDSGRVRVFGREIGLPVAEPARHGIAVIHQDVGLVNEMTVLENLGANARYGARLLGSVNVRREKEIYTRLFERLEINLPFDARVADLSPAEHALVGVVRAMRLMSDGDLAHHLFILDEPTAYLSRTEAQRLTTFMRRVAAQGSSVIFISHRLNEVLENCDAVTVLRDGRAVLNASTSDLTRPELVRHMLGRRLAEFYPAPPARKPGAALGLRVDRLSGDVVRDFSIEVEAGEIVGFTGLAGMGQEELPLLISGAKKPASGAIAVSRNSLPPGDIPAAIEAGIALIPGNRHRDGCWLDATAAENVTLPALDRFRRRGRFVDWRAERATARNLIRNANVRPFAPELPLRLFSGGNQQKVVFGKWLNTEPRVLLLDEPTQGVDAGASRDLLDRVAQLAAEGTAVLIFSGDYEQIAAVCHRAQVLHHGEVIAELAGDDLTEHGLIESFEGRQPAGHRAAS